MATVETPRFIDVAGAANLLGLTVKATYAWIERGVIPHRRLGRRVLIPHNELIEYIEQLKGVSLDQAVETLRQRTQ